MDHYNDDDGDETYLPNHHRQNLLSRPSSIKRSPLLSFFRLSTKFLVPLSFSGMLLWPFASRLPYLWFVRYAPHFVLLQTLLVTVPMVMSKTNKPPGKALSMFTVLGLLSGIPLMWTIPNVFSRWLLFAPGYLLFALILTQEPKISSGVMLVSMLAAYLACSYLPLSTAVLSHHLLLALLPSVFFPILFLTYGFIRYFDEASNEFDAGFASIFLGLPSALFALTQSSSALFFTFNMLPVLLGSLMSLYQAESVRQSSDSKSHCLGVRL